MCHHNDVIATLLYTHTRISVWKYCFFLIWAKCFNSNLTFFELGLIYSRRMFCCCLDVLSPYHSYILLCDTQPTTMYSVDYLGQRTHYKIPADVPLLTILAFTCCVHVSHFVHFNANPSTDIVCLQDFHITLILKRIYTHKFTNSNYGTPQLQSWRAAQRHPLPMTS